MGRHSYGQPEVLKFGEPTALVIGSFCSIAKNVRIFLGGNHRTDWLTTYPFPARWPSARTFSGHPHSRGDVVIGHDVWIAYGATIMSGVTIGNGAVVGAFAVVTRDIPPYVIVAGNPARPVRSRFSETDIATLEAIAWWNWPDDKIERAMPILLAQDVAALASFEC